MPYSLDWYIKGRVSFMHLWGVLETEEMRQLNDDLLKFMTEGTPLIHMIVDDRAVEKSNVKIGDMIMLMQAARHPNMGWVVPIGEIAPVMKAFVFLFMQLLRLRYRRAKTIPDALDFLKSQDQSINWTEANSAVITSS